MCMDIVHKNNMVLGSAKKEGIVRHIEGALASIGHAESAGQQFVHFYSEYMAPICR
jgi:hypothetical protein